MPGGRKIFYFKEKITLTEKKIVYRSGGRASGRTEAYISSLITTIESLNDKLRARDGYGEKWKLKAEEARIERDRLKIEIESQKEETLGLINHIQKQDKLIHSQKEEIEKLNGVIHTLGLSLQNALPQEGDK